MSKQKIEKTNAARLLDKAGIPYELVPYTVDEENLAATHVAEELGRISPPYSRRWYSRATARGISYVWCRATTRWILRPQPRLRETNASRCCT